MPWTLKQVQGDEVGGNFQGLTYTVATNGA